MFSRKRHWISWTRFRPDPTRPDPDLGAQFSYLIPRPTPLRPDLTLESAVAPCWALSYPKDMSVLRIKGEVVNQVHQVRCGILAIWVCVTGSTRWVTAVSKISCGSSPTYESPDIVSKGVNWSQHPLQDPIHTGSSVFKQTSSSIGIQVYVQWAILCRCWRHTDL